MDKLNTTFQAASADMYNNAGGQAEGGAQQNAQDGEVTDVDFEEVKDDKK
jgi:hypothetical protein